MKREWRCKQCDKVLGVVEGGRLHIQFARGHQYIVGFPATSVCRGCRTLNELIVQEHDQGRGKHAQVHVRN
jgi:phage FluMu protein Com